MENFEMNVEEEQQIVADHGWQKVTYQKKSKKQPSAVQINNSAPEEEKNNVFRSLDKRSEERRRRILESQRAEAFDDEPRRSNRRDQYDDDADSDESAGSEKEAAADEKKVKVKKPKKPKVTVAEAAAKIEESDLASFLADITASYDGQQNIQLMRFADYFGKKFSAVSSSQFPWIKLFRESPVSKLSEIPLSHISDGVLKTSFDWINTLPLEALSSFATWCLDTILSDLAAQNPPKNSKKATQQPSSKSQAAIFVVLAMVVRKKPDTLVNVIASYPHLQTNDKHPLLAWLIVQAARGDLAVGLYLWTHHLLPLVSGKTSNPQSRDLVLQVVERILASPKARVILVNGAVRKGERVIPPQALESLLRLSFPPASSKVKATERFEAVYPVLKEVALSGTSGSKAMKQVATQIFSFSLKSAESESPEMSSEAADISIWCFIENPDCFHQWETSYLENMKGSVAILKRISENTGKLPTDSLKKALSAIRRKNEKAGDDNLVKEAEKSCKVIGKKLNGGNGYVKGLAFLAVAMAVGAAVVSPGTKNLDFDGIYANIVSKLFA